MWSLQHGWLGLLADPVYLRCAVIVINQAFHVSRHQALLSVLTSFICDV